ncbi:Crocetin glucosyltransferase, chloroplastic [Vitis vinifera]|uniref:Crocetin glucosyltransferase, chloroplastic n=1 Tax=Vitis vinifera TaxID=29760 RepID=A0A438G4C8_VITVI|nr:Crocetin glucosyltransferase, chloroplastic [Vitis vinifera]
MDKVKVIGIGPLVPSAFLDANDPSDTSFGVDIFQDPSDCIDWLNSKPKSSVVYVSFGTLCVVSKQQMEEIARALLHSGRPFLWVIRSASGNGEVEEEKLSCREELEEKGMIVAWCPQLDVLSHPSLGLKNLKKNEEFEDKIWRNTSIHSVIPHFTMNESINK